jgi:hypothetical protein
LSTILSAFCEGFFSFMYENLEPGLADIFLLPHFPKFFDDSAYAPAVVTYHKGPVFPRKDGGPPVGLFAFVILPQHVGPNGVGPCPGGIQEFRNIFSDTFVAEYP